VRPKRGGCIARERGGRTVFSPRAAAKKGRTVFAVAERGERSKRDGGTTRGKFKEKGATPVSVSANEKKGRSFSLESKKEGGGKRGALETHERASTSANEKGTKKSPMQKSKVSLEEKERPYDPIS